MPPLRLALIDLDGTLVRTTAFECIARAAGPDVHRRVLETDAEHLRGALSLEDCFFVQVGLFAGLPLEKAREGLARGEWLTHVPECVRMLKDAGLETGVLTDQPRFAVEHLDGAGFDHYLCSDAEVADGRLTGRMVRTAFDKLATLTAFCKERSIRLAEVAHAGNGRNDVPVFGAVGLAVAVNPSGDVVRKAARFVLEGVDDARDVAKAILRGP